MSESKIAHQRNRKNPQKVSLAEREMTREYNIEEQRGEGTEVYWNATNKTVSRNARLDLHNSHSIPNNDWNWAGGDGV